MGWNELPQAGAYRGLGRRGVLTASWWALCWGLFTSLSLGAEGYGWKCAGSVQFCGPRRGLLEQVAWEPGQGEFVTVPGGEGEERGRVPRQCGCRIALRISVGRLTGHSSPERSV